jgi:hypothetical protein
LESSETVFDPEDDETSQEEYRSIFRDYKKLVDKLLESHMKELEISAAQFETACEEAEGVLSTKFHQTLFEQIWAANDFDSFKRMMIQINIDLQLWALEILASRYGIIPASFLPEGTSTEEFFGDDDFFLREAKRRSMMETSSDIKKQPSIKGGQRRPSKSHVMEVRASVNEEPCDAVSIISPSPKVSEASAMVSDNKKSETKRVLKKDAVNDDREHPEIEIKKVAVRTPSLQQETRIVSPRHLGRKLPSMRKDMDVDEIKHRQEYLQRQRDKLLGLKKQEREKQLARIQDLERSGKRPQTAKFMTKEAEELKESRDEEGHDESGEKGLAYMRSLAARIKAEVADPDEDDDNDTGKSKQKVE